MLNNTKNTSLKINPLININTTRVITLVKMYIEIL